MEGPPKPLKCPACKGTGKVTVGDKLGAPCPDCNGSGNKKG